MYRQPFVKSAEIVDLAMVRTALLLSRRSGTDSTFDPALKRAPEIYSKTAWYHEEAVRVEPVPLKRG